MKPNHFWQPTIAALLFGLAGTCRLLLAQSAGPADVAKPAGPEISLTTEQTKLAAKYKELERVILRMAEVMQSTDPKRAALLRQAFAQSKDRQIDSRYEDLVKLLKQEQLYQASKGQVTVQQDLNKLLELLISGDRDKQIPNQRAEIKKFIERINKLIREEQGLQGETEGQGDEQNLTKRQQGVAEKTADLGRDLNTFDSQFNPNGNSKDGQNADDKDADGKKSDGKDADGKDADGKNSDGKDTDGKNSDAKNTDGKNPDGKDGDKPGDKSDKKSDDKNADGKNSDGKNPDGKSDEKSGEQSGNRPSDSQKPNGQSSSKSGSKSNSKSGQKGNSQNPSSQKPGNDSDKKPDDQKRDAQGRSRPDRDKPDQKPDDKSNDKKPDSKKSDSKSSSKSGQKSDSKSQQSKGDSKGQQQDNQPQDGQQQQGQPQKGQSQEGEQSDEDSDNQDKKKSQQQQSGDEDSPARKRVRQAEDRMREAKRKLEQAQRRGAADEQQKAIDELKQAKAELEEILRQLREEEIQRVLAQLESRFRKMLQVQIEVYEGTIRVDRMAEDEGDRDLEIESGKLSRKEAQITSDADKTLNLLHEEGSSVAFPEAVDQIREDMVKVTARLAQAKVGEMTQGIEQDIVKSLEEMIAALQKAQRDQQKQQRSGGGGGGGGGSQQDKPLVDRIAELKMIRALQVRVNTRTQRYSKLLHDGAEQADAPDLLEAVQSLSQREDRIHKTTRDIVVGKNK